MKNFYIITNQNKDSKLETTNYIKDYLEEKGAIVSILAREQLGKAAHKESKEINPLNVPESTECILVLGGDGTLLQAARDTLKLNIPLIGINLGTLGFLAEVEKSGIEEALEALLTDQYEIEERMLMYGEVLRDGEKIWSAHALNDIVVGRKGPLMVLGYDVIVNGQFLNRYKADGMILATPTGSTGYNMSAGGPIVEPRAKLLVMTPVCPHTLNTRSIILSPEDQVEILISEGREGVVQQAEVHFDGGLSKELTTGDRVIMKRSREVVRLVHINKVSFLEVLHKKMSES